MALTMPASGGPSNGGIGDKDRLMSNQAPQSSSPGYPTGNYYMFDCFIELTIDGVTYLGTPRQAWRVGKIVRWVVDSRYVIPSPSIPRVPWIDDPERGLARRTIQSAEDLLGCQGALGGQSF